MTSLIHLPLIASYNIVNLLLAARRRSSVVEQGFHKAKVAGSIPAVGTKEGNLTTYIQYVLLNSVRPIRSYTMRLSTFAPVLAVLSAIASTPSYAAVQTPSLGVPAHKVLMTIKYVNLGVPALRAPIKRPMVMDVRSHFGNPNQKPRVLLEVVPVHLGQTSAAAHATKW